jgi:peptidoglycan lytic transglycosylase
LHPVFRLVFAALGGLAAFSATARADGSSIPASDAAALAAVAAARSGDWAKAYAEAAQSKDAAAPKVVRWLDYTRASPGGKFAEIAAFVDQNPDWPLQKTLRRRAEAAMAEVSDDIAGAWLQRHPPISGPGEARAAAIMIDRGDAAGGAAALRKAWVEGDFTPSEEHALLARFAAMLRPEDHQKRLDRLLWDGQSDAAKRMLPQVTAERRALADARLALSGGAAKPEAILARVPAALRSDPGLLFDEARWDRKKGNYEGAAQLLMAAGADPVRAKAWWSERVVVARWLLAQGNSELAYKLVQPGGTDTKPADPEAEFLCGFIELHFRKDAAGAFDHFSRILGRVTSPYAKARADYWAGRAAAAQGNKDRAEKWYEAGADNMATFYGQLSAHQLGKDAPPHPQPEPQPSSAERAKFDASELVEATQLFFAADDRGHAATFLMKMAKSAKAPLDFAMLASLAEAHGRINLAIAIARQAIAAGMPLMVHGYPVTTLPSGGIAERPLLLAIVRQESEFAPDAMSPVGARGLMQLMPATAAKVASHLQLPFSLARLTADGTYNLTLGRSYIETLLDDFGGSYALAIAAYNAGPGRVQQWLHQFGDPRGAGIDMVDWIEMIPFSETRAYVQRVLENLQIYRGQDGDNSAFSLVADLAR